MLPSGAHFEYKAVVVGSDGAQWESGDNRSHTADPGSDTDPVGIIWNG